MHNGWKNYETWNVALWIQNDTGLCSIAQSCTSYGEFVNELQMRAVSPLTEQTPDDIEWESKELDIEALDKLVKEL